MPKFYVACGSHQLIVEAPTAKCAATKLTDQLLAPHVWIYDDRDLSEQDRRDHLVLEALLHMGSSLAVSERGFGHNEAGDFEVPEMIDEWHKLMTGISRLFVQVGIDPRRVLPSIPKVPEANRLPR